MSSNNAHNFTADSLRGWTILCMAMVLLVTMGANAFSLEEPAGKPRPLDLPSGGGVSDDDEEESGVLEAVFLRQV